MYTILHKVLMLLNYIQLLFVIISASLGAIFGVTTCLSAHVRDAPDDPTNYFVGGCASGAFLGARSEYIGHSFCQKCQICLLIKEAQSISMMPSKTKTCLMCCFFFFLFFFLFYLFTAIARSVMIGTTGCMGLGIVAMLTKVGKKEGWRLYGEPRL